MQSMIELQTWLAAADAAYHLCQNKSELDLRIAKQKQRLLLMYFPELKPLRLTAARVA
jgi:hypothetical protein